MHLPGTADLPHMKGTIFSLIKHRGFGFILDEEGVKRFFHAKKVTRGNFDLLEIGQRVEFEPIETAQGLRAENVRIIK